MRYASTKSLSLRKDYVDFIVKNTGIDQSQISRILSGKSKTKSENYNKLCKFAVAIFYLISNNCSPQDLIL